MYSIYIRYLRGGYFLSCGNVCGLDDVRLSDIGCIFFIFWYYKFVRKRIIKILFNIGI